MSKSVFVIKGISGSGKSSRVFQILKYFQECGMKISDFKFTNIEGKERTIGVLIEKLNIVFIGKIYQSGEIERWQGYDAVTGAFCKAMHFSEFLKENKDKYSFVIEGAGITQTHRLRPKFLKEEIGFGKIFMQYYNYENREEYLGRIIYRSGEPPKKDVMWEKNGGFISDYNFSVEDSSSVDCFLECNNFDAPIYDLGVKLLPFLGASKETVEDFKIFVTEFDYINKNKFENFK